MPTGLASVKRAGLPTLAQMCWGSMAVPAMFSRLVYWAVGKLTVTVLPELVTLEMSRPERLMAAYFFTWLKVKTTSAAVKGVPSFHLTPLRIVNVIDLPPLLQANLVANQG